MNILNLSNPKINDAHTYYGGAAGNIIYNLVEALAELDSVEVDFATEGTDIGGDPPASLRLHEATSRRSVRRLAAERLPDADIATHLYFFEPQFNLLAKTVQAHDVPFIVGMAEAPHPRFADEVSGVQRVPLVRPVGRRLLLPLCKRTLRRCDRLIVIDEQAKRHYASYIPEERIDVIPYGVDLDRFEPTDLPERPRILMVNRLIERRGIGHMVAALPDVASSIPELELHVVGEGERRDTLEAAARENGTRERITFHGNVDATRLVELYRDSSVFAHLSSADGWNQPALEAMASAKPVVVTDRPHNSMVVDGETGIKVPWASPSDVAEALVELLSSPNRAGSMGAAARERVERRYTWDRIAREYLETFRSVTG